MRRGSRAPVPKKGTVPVRVSLMHLVVVPDRYRGAYVAVDGFLQIKDDEPRLYHSQAHADHLMTRDSIPLAIDTARLGISQAQLQGLDGRYVYVVGTCEWTGTPAEPLRLRDLNRIAALERWYDGARGLTAATQAPALLAVMDREDG